MKKRKRKIKKEERAKHCGKAQMEKKKKNEKGKGILNGGEEGGAIMKERKERRKEQKKERRTERDRSIKNTMAHGRDEREREEKKGGKKRGRFGWEAKTGISVCGTHVLCVSKDSNNVIQAFLFLV